MAAGSWCSGGYGSRDVGSGVRLVDLPAIATVIIGGGAVWLSRRIP